MDEIKLDDLTNLGVGEKCLHRKADVGFRQTGKDALWAVGVISSCPIGGVEFALSNIKYFAQQQSDTANLRTLFSLSEGIEAFVDNISTDSLH